MHLQPAETIVFTDISWSVVRFRDNYVPWKQDAARGSTFETRWRLSSLRHCCAASPGQLGGKSRSNKTHGGRAAFQSCLCKARRGVNEALFFPSQPLLIFVKKILRLFFKDCCKAALLVWVYACLCACMRSCVRLYSRPLACACMHVGTRALSHTHAQTKKKKYWGVL